jgi:ubiquinone/menaquinone biosynthesis methyltransferase
MSGVQAMFDRIAPTYDTLNRVLSLGIDRDWRRKAISALGDIHGRRVLDVCAGTLDLSTLALDAGAEVVATDFSQAMLSRGRGKILVPMLRADALALPFADDSFAGVVCGFGLRNLPDARAGLDEMRRVTKPGGRCVILDFFRPQRVVTRAVQAIYNRRVLPLVGGALSGDLCAYKYLASSIESFASRAQVEAMCRDAGFLRVDGTDLTLGVAALVVARC